MRYENWRNKFFLFMTSFLDNTLGKELISFIINQINLFIWKLGRSGFMLYLWSINKFNFVTRDYWQNGSFVSFLHCLTCFSSWPCLKLLILLNNKDLKLTILFCLIVSGIFALVSKVHDLNLIGLSLKKSFVCSILCFQHNSYFWSNCVCLLVWNQVY